MNNLIDIPHQLDQAALTCRAIVETPRGSRSKFDYDPENGLFELYKLLPAGMSFPLDFGFVPATRAEDGDPLDILVLHDEPIPVGALATVRLLGVILGEQAEDGRTERNDRLLAVTAISKLYGKVRRIEDLEPSFVDHLARFWVNYNALSGREYRLLGVDDALGAVALIKQTAIGP